MSFSIITPSYKQLDWLRLCVASVRDQIAAAGDGIENVEWEIRNGECHPSSADRELLDRNLNSKFQIPILFPLSTHSEFSISNSTLFNSDLAVEHIIQDAGSPGIEEFAREVGADFYRDGLLVFRGKNGNVECRMRNAELPDPPNHPESKIQNPKFSSQNSTLGGEFHENPAESGNPVKNASPLISKSQLQIPNYSLSIYSERDNGMYDAINRGFARSTGEILAYLNCDEQYLPETLTSVLRFFEQDPKTEVAFGDTIIVSSLGTPIASRPAVIPTLCHSMVGGTLAIYTASTFFRSSILTKGLAFDTNWRDLGDAEWLSRIIRSKSAMRLLKRRTTAFTDTGANMNFCKNASIEKIRWYKQASLTARIFKHFIRLRYRAHKLLAGHYNQNSFDYCIYALSNPQARVKFHFDKPHPFWHTFHYSV